MQHLRGDAFCSLLTLALLGADISIPKIQDTISFMNDFSAYY
jgi:hypothetical protein